MKLTPKQIKSGIIRWSKILALDSKWKITHQIRKNITDMSEDNIDSMACIDISAGYFLANIQFNEKLIENEKELNETILHELLHLMVQPLAQAVSCGLGEKYIDMTNDMVESTIERLMVGYLFLEKQK